MVLKIHSMITKAFTTSTTASSKAPWTSFLVTAGLSMRSLLTTHSYHSVINLIVVFLEEKENKTKRNTDLK